MPRMIVVIGSANIDLVTRVPRIPKPGETLLGHSFATVTGGKGANQAVAAARLGGKAHFVGCVGADAFGEQQRLSLAAAGVNLAHLHAHPSEPTGTAVILVADAGQNSIVVTPGANHALTPEDLDAVAPLIAQADAVVLQLEIRLDTVERALALASEAGVLSVLDAGSAQQVPESLLRLAGVVSPNETEAEAMTGLAVQSVEDAKACARRLREMGAREVVMKLGAQGSYYLGEAADEVYAPAFPVQVVDTTAAGDAFTAALAIAWGTAPVQTVLEFANAAGALAATLPGAQPSMPMRSVVDAFLREQSA